MTTSGNMLSNFIKRSRRYARRSVGDLLLRWKTKYFCVGRNKTGTTSLLYAFKDLGFPTGNQRAAEILAEKYYFEGNFGPIVDYCKTAQVFQDVPFSYPGTYRHLDVAFPGSKFILTIRKDPEEWYSSLVRSHSKLFGKNGQTPTAEELKSATYACAGFMYNFVRLHGTQDSDLYNKEIMIAHYEKHNREIIDYFRTRQKDFLVLDVSAPGAYQSFVDFLGIESSFDDFPWQNRT